MPQDLAPVPCISCRLRRKKCDRKTPWCGRCKKLHIPQEWCIYQDGIRLYDKDSDTTLDRQLRLNRDLKRELAHTQLMLDLLSRHRDNHPDEAPHLFFGGTSRNGTTTLWGSGYHGAASVPATLPREASGSMGETALIVFTTLFEERRRENAERKQRFNEQASVLSRFENLCLGSLVEFPGIDGDNLIRQLIDEINRLLPPAEGVKKLLSTFRDLNLPRYVLGPPVYPESVLEKIESLLEFYDDGTAAIKINLPKESNRLVYLSLLLLSMSKSQFVLQNMFQSPSPPESKVNHIIYHRYAAAILKVDLIGDKIRLPDATKSLPLTLALVEHHLALDYNPSANLRLSDDGAGPDRVMTTRALISRAKYQCMHQDMVNYYPELSRDERQMYNDTWFLLVYMDLMDSIEYGYLSSVQVADFHAGAYTGMKTIGALRTSHEVLNEVSLLDGELTPEEMIEYLQIGIKKMKTAFRSLEHSAMEDRAIWEKLDYSLKEGQREQPPPEHRQVIERIYTRLVLLGMIQSLYAMLKRCVTDLGETPENSQRAFVFDIIAHKTAFTGLNLLLINFANVFEEGQRGEDQYLFKHIISLTQDAAGFEIISATKSVIWLGATIMKHTGLTGKEIAHYVLYQKEDEEMNKAIIDKLSEQPQFKNLPAMLNLNDFEEDDDPARLIREFGSITDPKVVTYLVASIFSRMRTYVSSYPFNFSFVKLSRTFMLGIRFSTFALKCFFPDEVNQYQSQAKNKSQKKYGMANATSSSNKSEASGSSKNATPGSTETSTTRTTIPVVKQEKPVTTGGDAFIGTFADLFQQGIETSKEFDLSEYFGSSYDEHLQESWAGDFISSVGFDFPSINNNNRGGQGM